MNIHPCFKYSKISFLAILMLFLLSSCSLNDEVQPIAKDGVLDLRSWDFQKQGNVNLNGEWEFYWNKEYKHDSLTLPEYIQVPGLWNDKLINGKKLDGHGYAIYRLRIKKQEMPRIFALKLSNTATSARIFVDGNLISESGQVATSASEAQPSYKPHLSSFYAKGTDVEIVVEISNYHHWKGGMWGNILLGTQDQIYETRNVLQNLEFFLYGGILMIALYHLGMFFARKEDYASLFFSLFSLVVLLRIVTTGEHSIFFIADLPWTLLVRLEYLSFYLAQPLLALFLYSIFPKFFSKKILYFILIESSIFSIVTLFTSVLFFSKWMLTNQIITVIGGVYLVYVILVAIFHKTMGAKVLLLGWLFFFGTIVHDILIQNQVFSGYNLSIIGMFFFVASQANILSRLLAKTFLDNQKYKEEVNYQNKHLEQLIKERTQELVTKNDAIEHKTSELEYQKEKSEDTYRQISDSMKYASRIQAAVMPERTWLNEVLPEHMVMFKPKEVISGDFYWMKIIQTQIFIVVADCTGHGVPGAFMSMLGTTLLNEVVARREITKAGQALNALREALKYSLRQTGHNDEAKDGMDLALCIIDTKSLEMQYSGAYNPLFIVREVGMSEKLNDCKKTEKEGYEMIQLDPDSQPIGVHLSEKEFTNRKVQLHQDDTLYMMTDGYGDQIGGKKGRKFMSRRFKQLLLEIHQKPFIEQRRNLETIFEKWKNPLPGVVYEQIDDVLVFGFKPIFNIKTKTATRNYNWETRSVLIVEDEEIFYVLMREMLRKTGVTTFWAEDGSEAIKLCRENPKIDIVLMDLGMPVMDGYETTEKLRALGITTPIIVQTAFKFSDEKERAFIAGCDDYITKPITEKELLSTIAKYITATDTL